MGWLAEQLKKFRNQQWGLCTYVGFEMWHLGLMTGLVVLISSSRYLLLKIWPEFAESSEAANRQEILRWP
ncbi:unnamed protein product [Trifolium pratense]|uniref:Uncharacterized protein n=3 Tax=Trifolium pratense TaxID=57577 RepID=A0ACB0MG82_TRIPR|nr:unnamed protein product [Trifolium pratense]CAJ2679397.1 unnamed protein product [Trifolium pratense]CAJ2679403.1 unnamed protein product [Trifolium pratense]